MSETDVDAFLNAAWAEHADDAEGVFARFEGAFALVSAPAQAPRLAALMTHVAGEHLGRWDAGLELLARLRGAAQVSEGSDEARAIHRSEAVLQLCKGDSAAYGAALAAAHAGESAPEASTAGRIRAVAACALAGQRRLDEALALFREVLELAAYGPGKEDPLARALAVTSNNLACELEETSDRSSAQDELLELAATTARAYWEIAGSWNNVQIAEYRLAMTYLALGRPETAQTHARQVLAICEEHDAGAGDLFFAHEAAARCAHALGEAEAAGAARDRARAQLDAIEGSFGDYARGCFEKLEATLAS